MAQATFSIRMDEKLKRDFDEMCAEFGMTATTAFNIFARTVVRERRIPFEISALPRNLDESDGWQAFLELREAAARNGIQDMTLQEIDEEIKKVREELQKKGK